MFCSLLILHSPGCFASHLAVKPLPCRMDSAWRWKKRALPLLWTPCGGLEPQYLPSGKAAEESPSWICRNSRGQLLADSKSKNVKVTCTTWKNIKAFLCVNVQLFLPVASKRSREEIQSSSLVTQQCVQQAYIQKIIQSNVNSYRNMKKSLGRWKCCLPQLIHYVLYTCIRWSRSYWAS